MGNGRYTFIINLGKSHYVKDINCNFVILGIREGALKLYVGIQIQDTSIYEKEY